MGCWNASCFLTNLPITYGEDVRVFILHKQENSELRYCYPTASWRPFAFSFKGKYNDYGSIEEENGIMLNFIIDSIKKDLMELELGENRYHDIEVKKEGFDFEKMMEANHEGRLFVTNLFGKQSQLKMIMVKESSLNSFLDRYSWETISWDEQKKINRRFINYKTRCDEIKNELLSLTDKYLSDRQHDVKNSNFFMFLFKVEKILFETTSHIANAFSAITAKDQNLLQCTYDDIVEEVTIVEVINNFLSDVRRTWTPPSGEGSQQNETEPYKMFAQLLLDECAKIDKQHSEWEKENEDEDE